MSDRPAADADSSGDVTDVASSDHRIDAPPDPLPTSIIGWLVAGSLDASLLATVWLLAEGGVPIVVAGARGSMAAPSLAAALDVFGRPTAFLTPFPPTVEGESLEAVLEALRRPPFSLTEDAARSVGVVLVLRQLDDGRLRVAAAHYVRPLEQDPHGHVQRRPPAVLAAWDADADRFDDYAWGITTELAGRIGVEPAAFERARAERAAQLEALARAGTQEPSAVATALAAAAGPPARNDASRR